MTQQIKYIAFVDCPEDPEVPEIKGCGTQGLTEEQYNRQMSNPHATWRCPCCGGEASFNDELSEQAMLGDTPGFEEWPATISL